jgi:hypothetical protein
MISFLVCFEALYQDRARLAAPDHKPGPPGSGIFNSPRWALLRMAHANQPLAHGVRASLIVPFRLNWHEHSGNSKSLKVDSRTALAAFIVYLLLPEFWVGWKQA